MNITNPELMKSKELRKLIREAISDVLKETTYVGKGAANAIKTDPKYNTLNQTAKNNIAVDLTQGKDVELDELARKAKGYKLADENIDATPFATKTVSGVNMQDVINFFRENPGAEKTQLQSNFNFRRPQIANAIVNALKDAGVLVKLGAEGEPELGGEEPTPVSATDAEDMFVGGAEDPLAMYFDNEPNADGSEDFEPEAGEIEKAEPVNTSNVSDEDMEASYKYTELERRLAAAKSNILKLKRSKASAGDIKDKPSSELERLRALKTSLEQRIADLKANSAYVRKLSNTPEPEDIEMPDTEEEPIDEALLAEYRTRKLQYYAGIIK